MTIGGSIRNRPARAFGERYSEYYDLLYSDKDYEGECDYIETVFRRFSSRKIRRVLDVACGTGGHTIPLAKRGYSVSATDISKHMLAQARKKVVMAGLQNRVHLGRGDMRFFRPMGKFDACLSMFGAIGYLSSYEDVLAALRAMHRHLKPNGLLIFDFWNGVAVLQVLPSAKRKRVAGDEIVITREATPKLDAIKNVCNVKYLMTVSGHGQDKQMFSEIHTMRFFFPEEVRLLLSLTDFQLVSLHPFLRPDLKVSNKDWNLTAISRAV